MLASRNTILRISLTLNEESSNNGLRTLLSKYLVSLCRSFGETIRVRKLKLNTNPAATKISYFLFSAKKCQKHLQHVSNSVH